MQRLALISLLLAAAAVAHPPVVPKNSAKPIGPYSPGMEAGGFLYASGQSARDADGRLPATPAGQARQCLNNVQDILAAGGLTMRHVVALQMYLADLDTLAEVDQVYKEFFPDQAPARVVVGTVRMPFSSPIEITVVAVKDLSMKRVTAEGVWAGDRLYLNAIAAPSFLAAYRELQNALQRAGLSRRSVTFENTYTTVKPSPAEIRVAALPGGAKSMLFVVADKNPGEVLHDGCREARGTLFCEARASSGEGTIEEQTRELFAQLTSRIEAHGYKLDEIAAVNVWMNELDEFQRMNAVYATYFPLTPPPSRTTLQPAAAATGPALRLSIVAVH
ncbi:MAG: Rid family hydrolase [Bryobacteraceae bacterium]